MSEGGTGAVAGRQTDMHKLDAYGARGASGAQGAHGVRGARGAIGPIGTVTTGLLHRISSHVLHGPSGKT